MKNRPPSFILCTIVLICSGSVTCGQLYTEAAGVNPPFEDMTFLDISSFIALLASGG